MEIRNRSLEAIKGMSPPCDFGDFSIFIVDHTSYGILADFNPLWSHDEILLSETPYLNHVIIVGQCERVSETCPCRG
jgi:hypothetical protein